MKPIIASFVLTLFFTVYLQSQDISQLFPPQSVTIQEGESITFNLETSDEDGLDFVEWYIDSEFIENIGIGPDDYYEQILWEYTFNFPGYYEVFAYVYDNDGNDNFVWWGITVEEIGCVDLIVSEVYTEPDCFYTGDEIDFYAVVENVGNITTSSDIHLNYYVNGEFIDDDVVQSSLSPGESDTEFENNILFDDAGQYTVTVEIEIYSDGECSTSNNSNGLSFNVNDPPGSILLTQPNAPNETYSEFIPIKWQSDGDFSSFDLQYSDNNGVTWNFISSVGGDQTTGGENNYQYLWSISDEVLDYDQENENFLVKVLGYVEDPICPDFYAIDISQETFEITQPGNYFVWKGMGWVKRSSSGVFQSENPGNNIWSNDESSIFIDSEDNLHLKIRNKYGYWTSAEVMLLNNDENGMIDVGYGEYVWYTKTNFNQELPSNVVAAFYTYQKNDSADYPPVENEIDIEISQWDPDTPQDSIGNFLFQYREHPDSNNQITPEKFLIEQDASNSTDLTFKILWSEGQINYSCHYGHSRYPSSPTDIIAEHEFSNSSIPDGTNIPNDENEVILMNLWIIDSNGATIPNVPNTDENEVELIVSDFQFHPEGETLQVAYPNGGETLEAGTEDFIIWNNPGSITNIQLEYSVDGVNWISINTSQPIPNDASDFFWNVPEGIDSDNCLIKVSAEMNGESVYDISDDPFTIQSNQQEFSEIVFNGNIPSCNEGYSLKLFEPGNDVLLFEFTGNISITGDIVVNNIPSGAYDVILTIEKYLGIGWLDVDFSPDIETVISGELVAGDINNDNEINIQDFSIFATSYGTVAGESEFNPMCDLDCSSSIDIADFSLFGASYGLDGVSLPSEIGFCNNLELYVGDSCNDGDENTSDDIVTNDCECVGSSSDFLTGLVSFWNFEDGFDDVHGENHGTPMSGVSEPTNIGPQGSAPYFDGSSNAYINCGNDPSLNITSDALSMSAWIYSENGANRADIISKGRDYTSNKGYHIRWNGNEQSLILYSIYRLEDGSNSLPTIDLPDVGTWHHVVSTYDGQSGKLYLNGTLVAEDEQAGTIGNATTAFIIGAHSAAPSSFYQWEGYIDEVGVWGRVLTDSEISALYNGGEGVPYSQFGSSGNEGSLSYCSELDLNVGESCDDGDSSNGPDIVGVDCNCVPESEVLYTLGDGVTDIDGNSYSTIILNGEEWMAENLKVSHFNNGDEIPNIEETSEWNSNSTGAFCWYENDESYDEIYGKLYNWYAVNTGNLCPSGWHVPSTFEWNDLMNYLDSDGTISNNTAGGPMKADSDLWSDPNNGATNYSGFNGLPSGSRTTNGSFIQLGVNVKWWSSSPDNSVDAWNRYIMNHSTRLSRDDSNKHRGHAVRCKKD